MTEKIASFSDLRAYRHARDLALQLYEKSRQWPKEEVYSLTSQIRRSSRAVGASLAEAWAKRRYPAHFLSKLTDADAENSETDTWLEFAKDSECLSVEQYEQLVGKAAAMGRMLGAMLKSYDSFCQND